MPASSNAWGDAELTVMVGGVDVSCEVLRLTVDRSKNRLFDPPDAGTCQIELDITASGQPPSRGPVGATVTVNVAYGAQDRYLFTGEVQRRQPRVDPDGDTLTLDCVDGFEKLARLNLRAAEDPVVGVGEAVQQRIARWLDAADWPSGARALDSSDFTCPGTDMVGNVLLQIQAAALADGGDFYIDGDGVAVFRSWNWHTTGDTAEALFSDRRMSDWVPYSSASVTDDLDEVQNRVYGSRRPIDDTDTPATLVSDNAASVTTYGERGDALDDLELEDDTQVGTRLTALVAVAGGPNARFDSIVVQPAFEPDRSWPMTLPITFSSLIAANRLWADGTITSLFGHVIGEQWTWTPDDVTVEYRVSGTGTWDGTRPPRPPPKVIINENGCLQIPPGYPCDEVNEVVVRDADHNILETYPPGSLCYPNEICDYPPETVEVCYIDAEDNAACYPIDDPRLTAILWADVVNPPSLALIERIEDVPIDVHPSLDHTEADVSAGIDGMLVGTTGGVIAAGHSGRLEVADLSGSWTLDFWLYLDTHFGADTFLHIIELQALEVKLTTEYQTTGPYITEIEIQVTAGAVAHLSGPLCQIDTGDWHHYVIAWDSANVGTELVIFVDGTEV